MSMSIEQWLSDPVAFISSLTIIGKDGKLCNLLPNEEQMAMIEAFEQGEDILTLKARQIGSSTICVAWLFYKAYTSTEPVTMGLMSHKAASAQHLLKMAKIMLQGLPDFLQRKLSVDKVGEFRFNDTGAGMIAVSAGGKGGLRSFSCTKLMISEYGFADDPDELKATAISAVNGGQLIIETTANYHGDAMYQEIHKSKRGEADWNYMFFGWQDHSEYTLPVPDDMMLTDEEELLKVQYSLTNGQLYWRRKKKGKLGKDKFMREYPISEEEAYTITGNTYLCKDDFNDTEVVTIPPDEVVVFCDPQPNDVYAIGVDVSAGVGRDYSVIHVLSKCGYHQVYTFRSNTISPVELANVVADVATTYNNAKVLVESNNMGAVTINELHHLGYNNLYKKEGKDWLTTLRSKTDMFEHLKKTIREGYVSMIDMLTYTELRAITVNNKGHIQLPEVGDGHGDSAVALALAHMCLDTVRLLEKHYLPSWVLMARARKKKGKSGSLSNKHRRY